LDTLRLLRNEVETADFGNQIVVRHLLSTLFVCVLREWADAALPLAGNWFSALRSPHIARALACIHEAPANDWTLDALAEAAGLSRSAFAAQFRTSVGEPPHSYLIRWRWGLRPNSWSTPDCGWQKSRPASATGRNLLLAAPSHVLEGFHRRGFGIGLTPSLESESERFHRVQQTPSHYVMTLRIEAQAIFLTIAGEARRMPNVSIATKPPALENSNKTRCRLSDNRSLPILRKMNPRSLRAQEFELNSARETPDSI
jgi:hypothetical protein